MTYAEALNILKTYKQLSRPATQCVSEERVCQITGNVTTETKEIGIAIPNISKEEYLKALQIVSSYPLRAI